MVTEDRIVRPRLRRARHVVWLAFPLVAVAGLVGPPEAIHAQVAVIDTDAVARLAARPKKTPARRVRPDHKLARLPEVIAADAEERLETPPETAAKDEAETSRVLVLTPANECAEPTSPDAACGGATRPIAPRGDVVVRSAGASDATVPLPTVRPDAQVRPNAPTVALPSGAPVAPQAVCAAARQRMSSAAQAAERRALYTARAEFLEALRQLAENRPAAESAEPPATVFAEAFATLEEADDFVAHVASGHWPRDAARIAATHRSAASKTLPAQATSASAARHYVRFASQRLAMALGESSQVSWALHGLGKVHVLLAAEPSSVVPNPHLKAEAMYDAAVRTDRRNWQAANELGVLLAKQGRYAEAAVHLQQSVAVQPRGESLHNLAVVLHHCGQTAQARELHQHSLAMGYGRPTSRRPEVIWVSPDALAGTGSKPIGSPGSAASGASSARQANSRVEDGSTDSSPPQTEAKAKGLFWWLHRK
jgi:hypothetical protein